MAKVLPKRLMLIFSFGLAFGGFALGFALAEENLTKIKMETETGVAFEGYLGGPEGASAGVLLIHDWFGVSDFYLDAAKKLAGKGYRVLALDYYGTGSAQTHKQAYALMKALDPEMVKAKIETALSTLKSEDRSLAVFGFSLGTEFAYRASLRDGEVDAVALWYGFSPTTQKDVEGLEADVLVVLGSLDGPAAETGAKYSKTMDEAGKRGELYIWPGGHHAFAQPLFNGGATYDREGAQAAWGVTLDFLERKLQK